MVASMRATNGNDATSSPRGKGEPEEKGKMQEVGKPTEYTANGEAIIEIAPTGDLVLRIEHRDVHAFRVDSNQLKTSSKYFERILQPGRFGEAVEIEARQKSLREEYTRIADAPSSTLPVLDIQDLGRTSSVKAVGALLSDLLNILHGQETQAAPPVPNLANLAVVADRFDALDVVRSYVTRKKIVRAIDGKTMPKSDSVLSEERVRQRLLVAILLDYPPWLEKYSTRLIVKGWAGRESPITAPLWWDLPSRVEDELAHRRAYLLDAIQSLQTHFLRLYNARQPQRQCKLGYDSSAQCDSFQLGEMVRFFTRIGTLQLVPTLLPADEDDADDASDPNATDLYTLLDTLRQVPEYQIDRFHHHCGLRTRLVPLLDFVQECLQFVGICARCWDEDRVGYAWVDAKRPLIWSRQALRRKGCAERHVGLRDMGMARERDWS